MGYGAEICLSIVEAVAVDVVTEHTIRNINDQIVHLEILSWCVLSVCQRVDGIASSWAFLDVPFVFHQPVVIFGVNYGEFSFCQGDFSEGIAIPDSAIKKEQANARFIQPLWYVESNANCPASGRSS